MSGKNKKILGLMVVLGWLAAAAFSSYFIEGVSSQDLKTEMQALTPTVLHFQGNTEEGCTGTGSADVAACSGPFLLPSATLSTNPAAHWEPQVALDGTSDQNIYDPNWIWNLTGATRLGGPMTVEWWASCGGCGGVANADWNLRIWADGVSVFERQVRATPDLPNTPKLLSATVYLPEINASSKIVLQIDPVFIDSQQNTHIYYDSQTMCPGAITGPCDSKVTMPVLAPGDPVPTPTSGTSQAPQGSFPLPTFDNYQPPVNDPANPVPSPYPRRDNSGEPSIGVNWNTGNVMTMSRIRANRTTFNDATSPADPTNGTVWFSMGSPAIVSGLDPIGFTDSVTGRSIYGELNGAFTNAGISDDDLTTFTPNLQSVGNANGPDHQTIGGGPPSLNGIPARQPIGPYPHLFYYAAQGVAVATVSVSVDGGVTYAGSVPAYTLAQCGGLHGHIKVAPNDGTVYLPNKSCGGKTGVAVSTDNGLNWAVRTIPTSTSGSTDPSIGIGSGGKIYEAFTGSDNHPHVAVSDDKGVTWHDDWDLALSVSPNLTATVFMQAVAGDNERAAVFFIGTDSTNAGDPTGTDNGGAGPNFAGTWFPYIAVTGDGGKSWSVVRADNDPLHPNIPNPVQQGVVCTNGTTCPAGPPNTRNLLDFNEITVDARGRILTVYADGCNFDHSCINITSNSGTRVENQGIARLTIIRQRGGMRLFKEFDAGSPSVPFAPFVNVETGKKSNQLLWGTPNDGGAQIVNYRIYRGENGKSEKFVATVKAGVNTFTDNKIKRSRKYFYHVIAVNALGESPFIAKTYAKKGR